MFSCGLFWSIGTAMFYISSRLDISSYVNILRPTQDGSHFPYDIVKCIFLNDDLYILIKISLKFVPKGPINNIPALVQIMAWRRIGDKPLSEPNMVSLLTHICVTRPQWVNPSPLKKWLQFHRRQFQAHLHQRNFFISNQISLRFDLKGNVLGYGLAPNRRQAISWTNAGPVDRGIYTALGTDDSSWHPECDLLHIALEFDKILEAVMSRRMIDAPYLSLFEPLWKLTRQWHCHTLFKIAKI